MTVTPLPTTPLPAWLLSARAAMSAPFDPSAVGASQARLIVAEMSRFESQWAARKLAYIRTIDDAGVAKGTGATSTSTLISGVTGPGRPDRSALRETSRRPR